MTTFCGLDYCVFDDILASHILNFTSAEVLSVIASTEYNG